jgi:phosphate transport system substrate-binding protein
MKALAVIVMLLALAACAKTAAQPPASEAPTARPENSPAASKPSIAASAAPSAAAKPSPSPVPELPEAIKVEFVQEEDFSGRKFEKIQNFESSGFVEIEGSGHWRQFYRETPDGVELAMENGGAFYNFGVVSDSRENMPLLELTGFDSSIFVLDANGKTVLCCPEGDSMYEIAAFSPTKVIEVRWMVFWLPELDLIAEVDLESLTTRTASLSGIFAAFGAKGLQVGRSSVTLLGEDGAAFAKYGLNDDEFVKTAQADKLGGWSSISTYEGRPENWRQIVKDSQFQLGESYLRGYWGSEEDKTPYYGFRFGSYPMLDGSTVAVPMAAEFARQHLGLSESDVYSFVSFSATHEAYGNLLRKTAGQPSSSLHEKYETPALSEDEHCVDLILATYPSEEELAVAEYRNEKLKIEKVCVDAFVFIVNKDNPVDSLTLDQIRDIYAGRVTNWAEVGGNGFPVTPYQRDANSGSQTGMEQLVMQGEEMIPPKTAIIIESMGALVDAVAEYDNGLGSIGYSYKYYVDKLYKNDNIKVLKISGIPANEETMLSSAYPLAVGYYGATRESDGPGSVGHKFLEWILSDEGQECVAMAGYVPVRRP